MKTLFYPLNYCNREVLIYKDYLKEEFRDPVYCTEKKDSINNLLEITKKYNIDFKYEEDIFKLINKIDSAVILPIEKTNIENYKNILKIIESNVRILNLDESIKDLLIYLERDNNSREIKDVRFDIPREIVNIDVPVILIAGLNKFCDKFSTQLLIGNFFKNKGYNVSQFSTRKIANLFDIENLPRIDCMLEYRFEEQALLLNKYFVDYIKNNQPDLIIIDIEEGIMPMNNSILNNFGYLSKLLSFAIPIDYTILNIYYQSFISDDFIKMLDEYIVGNLGSELFSIGISNTMVEFKPETQNRELKFFHLDAVDKDIIDTIDGKLVFNVHDSVKCEEVFKKLFAKLTNNISIV